MPVVLRHASSPTQRAQGVSELIAHVGTYGIVTELSRKLSVSRQSLYAWKGIGERALEQALGPRPPLAVIEPRLERAVLTFLVEGHASERGIQSCLEAVGYRAPSLGTISTIIGQAEGRALQWFASHQAPSASRVLALDELFGNQRQAAYLSVVDAHSEAVWAAAGPLEADADSWTLLLWEAQDHGLRWHQTIGDGGRAIQGACATVDPNKPHANDVWHALHQFGQVQGRLDRLVTYLQAQGATVARQAARVAVGQKPLGSKPQSDVALHARDLATAVRAAEGLGYLGHELRRLLEVVVLGRDGLLDAEARRQELAALLTLLAELAFGAPSSQQHDLERLHTRLRHALPRLLVFAEQLEQVQVEAEAVLGRQNLALVAWAWQRRRILGPRRENLLAGLPEAWRQAAGTVMAAWDQAVRASSLAENWNSLLRPHLAVHRTLSPGRLALLAVWHNHRRFARGARQGYSPLQLSGIADAPTDWLVALGYPPMQPADRPLPIAAGQPALPEAA